MFEKLNLDHTPQCAEALFNCLVQERDKLCIGTAYWSLAEIEPSEADYDQLVNWAKVQTRSSVYNGLFSWRQVQVGSMTYSFAVIFGSVLFLLEAEHARRYASEGRLWYYVSDIPWVMDVYPLLFTSNGQPTTDHKEVLHRAAEALRLRHVFGVEGMQNWFNSIHLQFGFTRTGFQKRLPEWLVGQVATVAIRELRGNELFASSTFNRLWETLCQFRRRNINNDALRAFLKETPWVLPAWHDEIADAAIERIEQLGRGGSGGNLSEGGAEQIPFLSPPVLDWQPPAAPSFETELINLGDFDLRDSTYRIVVGSTELARLARQPDGSYAISPAGSLRISVIAPQLAARIESTSGGHIAAVMDLIFWDETLPLALFPHSTNRRLDDAFGCRLNPGAGVTLLAPSDLQLSPVPQATYQVAAYGMSFHLYLEGWSPSINVAIGDELVWSSSDVSSPQLVQDSTLVGHQIVLEGPLQFRLDSAPQVRVKLEFARNVTLRFARLGHRPLIFNEVWESEPVRVFEADLLRPPPLTIGFRAGGKPGIFSTTVVFPFTGTVFERGGEIKVYHPAKLLSTRYAATDRYRFFLPPVNGQAPSSQDFGIIEGSCFLERVPTYAQSLGLLHGYGGKLGIRRGPYNATGDTLIIAEQVVDSGVIKNVEFEGGCGCIRLTHALEIGAGHQVLLWSDKGIRQFTVIEDEGATEPTWKFVMDPYPGNVLGLGVIFDGHRIGSWFNVKSWSSGIGTDIGEKSARECAIFMRWFKAPILSDGKGESYLTHRETVLLFLEAYPSLVLPLWLDDHKATLASYELASPGQEEGWSVTLADLLYDTQFEFGADVALVIANIQDWQTLEKAELQEKIVYAMMRIAKVCPFLFDTTLRAVLSGPVQERLGSAGIKGIIDMLRSILKPKPADVEFLCQQAMRVDDFFLDALARQSIARPPANAFVADNYKLAVSHPIFRRLVASNLLSRPF